MYSTLMVCSVNFNLKVDLQFTRDGHPILFHDTSINRVTGQCDCIADLTLEEVKELDVGAKFGYENQF